MKRDAEKDLAVCNAATPGPWTTRTEDIGSDIPFDVTLWVDGPDEQQICTTDPDIYCNYGIDYNQAKNDAEFIATAREALPWWIKGALKLEKALRAVEYPLCDADSGG